MAVVIRVGYFCSAGHTEAGGMDRFLRQIDAGPEVEWVRCFPAIHKPGPKLGRAAPKVNAGLTGAGLVSEMLGRIERYHQAGTSGALDVALLIDDADCRFDGDASRVSVWSEARAAEVGAASGEPSPSFVALFASPEVEAWFIADWERGLGREYARLAAGERPLRAHVEELIGGAFGEVESYGGGLLNGACAHKLSERLQGLVTRLGGAYSKRTHGQDMLLRIRPGKVAEVCGAYFRPALSALLRALSAARARS